MNKRPVPVTIISLVFIAFGAGAILTALLSSNGRGTGRAAELWVIYAIRLTALVGGVFMLRGSNWARWLLALWMAYHLVLSVFHAVAQFLVHCLLFGVILCFLFLPSASAYFRGEKSTREMIAPDDARP